VLLIASLQSSVLSNVNLATSLPPMGSSVQDLVSSAGDSVNYSTGSALTVVTSLPSIVSSILNNVNPLQAQT